MAGGQPARGPVRPVLTGRALVLGAVLVLLVVLLAAPVGRFLNSRSDVAAAAAQLRSDRAELARLRAEQAQWSDPGFIQAQARARLAYAMPGDTVFVVAGSGAASDLARSSGTSAHRVAGRSWNVRLWDSVRAAEG